MIKKPRNILTPPSRFTGNRSLAFRSIDAVANRPPATGTYLAVTLIAACSLVACGGSQATTPQLIKTSGEALGLRPAVCPSSNPIAYVGKEGNVLQAWQCGTKLFAISGPNTTLNRVESLADDPTTGNIIEADNTEYTEGMKTWQPSQSGNVAPYSTLEYPYLSGATDQTASIATDSSGGLWLGLSEAYSQLSDASYFLYRWNKGDSGYTAPEQVVQPNPSTGTVIGFWGVTVGPSNNVWVIATNMFSVNAKNELQKYSGSSNGLTAPSVRIYGSNVTGPLTYARGIALGNGKIYVTNYSTATIYMWNQGDNGNVAPEHQISGSNTGLTAPIGIAIDNAGNVWVADPGTSALLVYSSSATGNATPIATYSIANGPDSLALCYPSTTSGTQCGPESPARRFLKAK